MATFEQQLISRIVHTGQLSPVLEWGITADDFLTSEGKTLFNTITTYCQLPQHHGAVIGPHMLKQKFPSVDIIADPGVPVEALCVEVRKRRLESFAKAVANKILTTVEIEPLSAINTAQEQLNQLQALGLSKNTDVSFSSAIDRVLHDYELIEQGLVTAAVSWPWEILNTMTGGLQEDDYIVLYGRPKSMKSWVMSAMIAHCLQMNVPILVYTKEMTPVNIFKRIAGIVVGVPYQELRRANLTPEEKKSLQDLRDYIKDASVNKNFVVLSGQDVADGGDTISWLRAKIDRYKPAVVFVDGLYLMSDGAKKVSADWTRVTAISRAARQMQLATKIPLVCTVQANRKAAGHSNAEFDEIAYADALGQDATIAMRIIAEKVQKLDVPTIACVLAGSREFKLHGFRIGGVPATDFSYKEVLTEKDIEEAKQKDHGDREAATAEQHARKRTVRKPATEDREAAHVASQLNGITVQ